MRWLLLRARPTLLLGCVVTVPLAYLPATTYDSVNVPKIGILMGATGVLLGILLWQIGTSKESFLGASLVVPALITLPLCLSWTSTSYRGWAAWGQYPRFQGLLPYIIFGCLSIVVAHASRRSREALLWCFATSGAFVSVYLLIQIVGLDPFGSVVEGITLVSNSSSMGNSNFAGAFLAVVLPISVHLWLSADRGRVLAIVCTILVGEGLLLSFSEGAYVAGLAGVVILLGFRQESSRARQASMLIAGGLAAALLGGVVISAFATTPFPSLTSRSRLWGSALGIAAESPLVGAGPGAYAIEAIRHRSVEDAIAHRNLIPGFTPIPIEYQTSDDPHSVPLALLANAGLLGMAGFLISAAWLIRRGFGATKADPTGLAFFASIMSYLVISTITVDEPTLRLGFWAAVGGLVAATSGAGTVVTGTASVPPARLSPWKRALLGSAAATLAAGSVWMAVGLGVADHRMMSAVREFEAGNVFAAKVHARAALSVRDEAIYRRVFAEHLGLAALDRGIGGAHLLREMEDLNRYLSDVPDSGAMLASARILNYWGAVEPLSDERALDRYRIVIELDRNSPLPVTEAAEALVDLERLSEAGRLLEPLTDGRGTASPEFWGALASIRLLEGDTAGARTALSRAQQLDANSCRSKIASELIAVQTQGGPSDQASLATFNLRQSCDRGMYTWFLARLAPEYRSSYQ